MKHQENISEAEIDKQLTALFTSVGMEHVPADFTRQLMQKIEQEKISEFIYKPVISKAAWIIIGTTVTAILLAAVFLFPDSGSAPAVMQKLSGIFSFQVPKGNFLHSESRLMQLLSESHVLLSVLAVTVVIGWQYLFMYGRNTGKRKGISGIHLF